MFFGSVLTQLQSQNKLEMTRTLPENMFLGEYEKGMECLVWMGDGSWKSGGIAGGWWI